MIFCGLTDETDALDHVSRSVERHSNILPDEVQLGVEGREGEKHLLLWVVLSDPAQLGVVIHFLNCLLRVQSHVLIYDLLSLLKGILEGVADEAHIAE